MHLSLYYSTTADKMQVSRPENSIHFSTIGYILRVFGEILHIFRANFGGNIDIFAKLYYNKSRRICGENAALSGGITLENHILHVRIRSSILRNELFYQREALGAEINRRSKIRLVNAVIIR